MGNGWSISGFTLLLLCSCSGCSCARALTESKRQQSGWHHPGVRLRARRFIAASVVVRGSGEGFNVPPTTNIITLSSAATSNGTVSTARTAAVISTSVLSAVKTVTKETIAVGPLSRARGPKRKQVIKAPAPVVTKEGPGFRLERVSQCMLPTDKGIFNLRAYRYVKDGQQMEPVVMFRGDIEGKEGVLMRVHDQCLTSEVLGSKRCDCKEQLDMMIDMIAAEKEGGMLLYLPQEGRGIGLANKIAAYALQEQGLDTVDANLALGFGEDERRYDYVPWILEDFDVRSVKLASNNPFKVKMLRSFGVEIVGRVPLQAPPNQHSMPYLMTKVLKMDHSLDLDMTAVEVVEVVETTTQIESSAE